MKSSLKFIKGMIKEAETDDPVMRKLQMYGGDKRKEQASMDRRAELQQHFSKRVLNQSENKDEMQMTSKLNKLVTLLRTEWKPESIAELLLDSTRLIQKKAIEVEA